MSLIKQAVQVKQPRVKADKTATLTFATLYELSKEEYDNLCSASFEGDDYVVVVIPTDNYIDFIIDEAERIAKDI